MNRLFAVLSMLLALVAALTACAPQPQVIYVVVTSSDTAPVAAPGTALPSPVPPTPAAAPTFTTPPDVALQLGQSALINGYFERAVAHFQSVLAQGDAVTVEQRAAAAFGVGQAALREGLFGDAVDALSIIINQYPNDPRIAQAYYLRGDAYLGLAQWQAALNDFQTYLTMRPGWVDSYAHESIGDAQLALGQTGAALASYAQAASAQRSLVPQLQLLEKIAQVYVNAGQAAQAVDQYDAILALAQNAPYRASIDYAAAQALLSAGDTAAGLARMRLVFDTYPTRPEAYQAMAVLSAGGVALDDYARGRVAYFYGDYQTAIELLSNYGTQMQLAAIPAELHLLLGRAYREIGSPDAAQVAFQTIISQYPQDPLFGDALLEQGRTLFLSNDIPGAIERYLFIADTYGYLAATAAQALWRAGYLYSTNGDPARARDVFTRLADSYPNSEEARSGLLIAASGAVASGQTAIAETLFARLAATSTGDDQSAAYWWVGKLALERGDRQTAQQAFGLAQQAAPDGYFAARAQDIVNNVAPFAPPAHFNFTFDEEAQRLEAEAWIRSTFSIAQDGDLYPAAQVLRDDPRFLRGLELWTLGHFEAAEIEFSDLLDAIQTDGLLSYQMAVFLRGIACYSPSIVAAANVIRAAGVSTLQAPAYLARMRYPAYYLDAVMDVSTRRGVDPLLIFALIRHESLFDPYATAAAGEKGLTQVIPPTGAYIASQLGLGDYQHSDLFRPYMGIEFGAYYLSEQLQSFDGNVAVALSGYNAGPGRAAQWYALSGGDPDLLMTTITIDSTRLYVQRIYTHYSIYRALYGG